MHGSHNVGRPELRPYARTPGRSRAVASCSLEQHVQSRQPQKVTIAKRRASRARLRPKTRLYWNTVQLNHGNLPRLPALRGERQGRRSVPPFKLSRGQTNVIPTTDQQDCFHVFRSHARCWVKGLPRLVVELRAFAHHPGAPEYPLSIN